MSPRKAAEPRVAPPWQRAAAGRYRSADERFTIESEGPSRWFVTDAAEHDELGLERTSGPFSTLDEAKAAATAQRERPARESPLAGRIAEATSGPRKPRATAHATRDRRSVEQEPEPGSEQEPGGQRPEREPRGRPASKAQRTWLEELDDDDREAAVRARRVVAALEREGVPDAETLVRRDVLGGQPVVAARLLAAKIASAIDRVTAPAGLRAIVGALPPVKDAADAPAALARAVALSVAESVVEVLTSGRRGGLPGWTLVERDGPTEHDREIRLSGEEIREAGKHQR